MKRSFKRTSLGPSKDSAADRIGLARNRATDEAQKADRPVTPVKNETPPAPARAAPAPKRTGPTLQVRLLVPITSETEAAISAYALKVGESEEITKTALASRAKDRFFADFETGVWETYAALAREYAEMVSLRKIPKIRLRISIPSDFEERARRHFKDPLGHFSAAHICAGFIGARLLDLTKRLERS